MNGIDLNKIELNRIDLNADVGESFGHMTPGDDEAIMKSVSSVNISCGFHAGDPSTIRRACAQAVAAGVVIGAHPSYRDLAGFGRRFVDVDPAELTDELIYQLGALAGVAAVEGAKVRYVKPHGALYNAVFHHHKQALAVVTAVLAVDPELTLLVLPGSEIERLAAGYGLSTVAEAFADRAYNPDGTLVSRLLPGAVLTDVDAVAVRCLDLALRQEVEAVDGTRIKVMARSICFHSDTQGAAVLAGSARQALEDAGVNVGGFI